MKFGHRGWGSGIGGGVVDGEAVGALPRGPAT